MLLGLLLGLAGASPAAAHATLLSHDPADGALLAEAPSTVTLTFDEPVTLRPGGVQVLDAAGATVDAAARSVDRTVVIDLPAALTDGTYVVSWRVVSADSHPVAGGFSFAVGAPSAGSVAIPVSTPDTALQVLRPVTEAVVYLGVLGGSGLAVFALLFLPGRPAPRRTIQLLGAAALVALTVMPPVTAAWQDAADVTALATAAAWRTGWTADLGLSAGLAGAGVIVVLAGTRMLTRVTGGRRRAVATAVFAGAGLALGALLIVGHTRSFGPAWLVLGSDLLHLATAAIWLGGILGLTHLLRRPADTPPAGSDAGTDVPAAGSGTDAPPVAERAAVVAAFSQVAAVLVALLGVAGVLLGWRIVGSWSTLFGTGYGLALLAKVAAVAVLIGIAGWNRYRLVPRTSRPDTEAAALGALRRTVRVEAALLVAVLAVTGVLVTRDPTAPPVGTDPTSSADGTAPDVAEQVVVAGAGLGDGQVRIRITPGGTGINALEVALFDAAGQPLEPVAPPTVTVSLPEYDLGPLERRLSQVGTGRYEAIADFPLAGAWEVEINARTSRFDSPIATIPVEIR
ncbi:copper resistance protein CopC [Solwaraspora sp. WMMD791]|uniref:copper resistance CopC/CopD family protein n=1 Tax=Solwaraspora sp. WMMD791 TaxID=3016086 RepID=UPI00249B99C4|nr:copper resistance protein CopC [Solwaraspora sp. WMMD791]WFE26886.1 copper resistance protein CopC [Solwaraspora sp. WMMD791]